MFYRGEWQTWLCDVSGSLTWNSARPAFFCRLTFFSALALLKCWSSSMLVSFVAVSPLQRRWYRCRRRQLVWWNNLKHLLHPAPSRRNKAPVISLPLLPCASVQRFPMPHLYRTRGMARECETVQDVVRRDGLLFMTATRQKERMLCNSG